MGEVPTFDGASSGLTFLQSKSCPSGSCSWTLLPTRVQAAIFGGLAVLFLLGNVCPAETLRVTTWNLGLSSATSSPPALIEEAAATLKPLDPDVILLQQVHDWQMCAQLAEALRPVHYQVLVCSAFKRASLISADPPQVAILSKRQAYFTWSEAWPGKGEASLAQGIAFAAIQTESQRLGFFSTLLADPQGGEELSRRLLQEVESIGRWETNQVQTFVIASSNGDFLKNPARSFRDAFLAFDRAGFVNALEQVKPNEQVILPASSSGTHGAADCLFAGPLGFPSSTRLTAARAFEHYPVTSDIELDPDKVTLALDIRAENRREREVQASLTTRKLEYWGGGGLVLLIVIATVLRISGRRRSHQALEQDGRVLIEVPVESKPGVPRRYVLPLSPASKLSATEPPALPPAPKPEPPVRTPYRLQRQRTSYEPVAPLNPTDVESNQSLPPGDAVVGQEPRLNRATLNNGREVREGVINEISTWLKQKLIRRLIGDREQLMEVQQMATHMATTLDARLARVELQIQQQNKAYLLRIEELNRELLEAREENRGLIRERIAQVKAEIEATRARVIAQAGLDSSSLRI